MPGLIKRLSKSGTDLSSCTKSSRSNSADEGNISIDIQTSEDETQRPSSAQSSKSVPASLKKIIRGRSLAAEIEAVQQTSNFSIFKLLKKKFSQARRSSMIQSVPNKSIKDESHIEDKLKNDAKSVLQSEALESTESSIQYHADTESFTGSLSDNKIDAVIKKKVRKFRGKFLLNNSHVHF